MSETPLVSIIINNYNYGRFLSEAINSALSQTYTNTEVIVVDDGSIDNSREIITKYEKSIIAIFKKNGGQASALNIGFEASNGEIIFFLDADDILLPTAAKTAVTLFKDPTVTKAHWPLWEINECGVKSGRLFPGLNLPEGNLLDVIIENGPDGYTSAPTSGNAWARRFLANVLPIPIDIFKINADGYLFMLAPIFGMVKSIKEPQGFYRIHGNNNFKGKMLQEETLAFTIKTFDLSSLILMEYLRKLGLNADPERWKSKSWFCQLFDSINDIKSLIPANEAFILVDEAQWEDSGAVSGRKVVPFIERNGIYWGPPSDDASAIQEIECQREDGVNFIVFAWPAFWWLDYYSNMYHYLKSNYKCLLQNERLIIFSLRKQLIQQP